eukprot:3558099-Rhodomonas_salina.1
MAQQHTQAAAKEKSGVHIVDVGVAIEARELLDRLRRDDGQSNGRARKRAAEAVLEREACHQALLVAEHKHALVVDAPAVEGGVERARDLHVKGSPAVGDEGMLSPDPHVASARQRGLHPLLALQQHQILLPDVVAGSESRMVHGALRHSCKEADAGECRRVDLR